jgi:hypothetical protein
MRRIDFWKDRIFPTVIYPPIGNDVGRICVANALVSANYVKPSSFVVIYYAMENRGVKLKTALQLTDS